jgi:uncharacterized integral membrane protein
MSRTTTDVTPQQEQRVRRINVARLFTAAVLIALVAALAVDNRQQTDVGWVLGDYRMPLFVVIIAAGVVGMVVGRLMQWRHARRRN